MKNLNLQIADMLPRFSYMQSKKNLIQIKFYNGNIWETIMLMSKIECNTYEKTR